MNTIFVGGVHGVGKSTCCAQVAEDLDCLHVTASDVIRNQKSAAIADNGKHVADVAGNQALLLRGFDRVRQAASGRPILLDGHFSLRDGNGHIQLVSVEVFVGLGVSHLVCFIDDPEAIRSRVRLRDRLDPDSQQLAALQAAELGNAHHISLSLPAPLAVLKAFDSAGLGRLLTQDQHLPNT